MRQPPMNTRARQTLSRVGAHGPLLVGLATALLAWAFIQISIEMVEGDVRGFDMAILRAARSMRITYPWLAEVMRDLSGLGSTSVLTLVTVVAFGYLAVAGARLKALLVVSAVILGTAAVNLLKAQFGRPRPLAEFAELVAPGMSFPSGHASISAIVFLTVAAMLALTRTRAVEQTYILVMAIVMTLLVGLSRVVLGVHWATDVAAGWAFGAAWALAWQLLARVLLRSGAGNDPGRLARKA